MKGGGAISSSDGRAPGCEAREGQAEHAVAVATSCALGDADELQWLDATNALQWIDPTPGTVSTRPTYPAAGAASLQDPDHDWTRQSFMLLGQSYLQPSKVFCIQQLL
ncbi:hypothetical protein VPH35_030282 [Triticum aestivum]|uniref:Uncharacterized protein n=1 Tax=Triticum turgidum subsp. durum TaxID=4567 RepID=A0A9R1RQH2_TRITD|nr:unnamed protein product [Triticum turgidum subsp. durum]